MIQLLKDLKKKCIIGYVGGSDLAKQKEQLGEDAATHLFDFGFSENGATAFKNGEQICNEVRTHARGLLSIEFIFRALLDSWEKKSTSD